MGFSIYDILKEDGEDNTSPAETGNDNAGADDFSIDTSLDDGDGGDPSPDTGGAPDPNAGGDDMGGGDDFDMGGDDLGGGDTGGDAQAGNSGGEKENTSDEAKEDNTDIFSSLTAEEQAVKLKELKGMYNELYQSIIDVNERINNFDVNERNLDIINRTSAVLDELARFINDYITNMFALKSFIENDIAFNRFLSIFNSIIVILDTYQKKEEKLEDK